MSDSPSVAEFKQQLHVVNAARIKALAAAREQPDASRKVELIAEVCARACVRARDTAVVSS